MAECVAGYSRARAVHDDWNTLRMTDGVDLSQAEVAGTGRVDKWSVQHSSHSVGADSRLQQFPVHRHSMCPKIPVAGSKKRRKHTGRASFTDGIMQYNWRGRCRLASKTGVQETLVCENGGERGEVGSTAAGADHCQVGGGIEVKHRGEGLASNLCQLTGICSVLQSHLH